MREIKFNQEFKNWRETIKKYQVPNRRAALIQIFNSFLPFLGLCVLMYFSLNWSYWITLGTAIITAFFLVRIFIIQHDCGHQSFFKSRKLNNLFGFISSFFSTIPFKSWSIMHSWHHAHNGQMEERGLGDIYVMTTEEFNNSTNWGRFKYRVFRHPLVQFIIVPIVYLGFVQRFQKVSIRNWKKVKKSHILNNLLILLFYTIIALFFGWKKILLIHLPIIMIFGIIAFWFFYIQHQHENNYYEWKSKWNHLQASMIGSSYYKLPGLLNWATGNIGFHHIHHLSSSIPNYNLKACSRENPIFNKYVPTLDIVGSLKCMNYKLWDADKKLMVSFKDI